MTEGCQRPSCSSTGLHVVGGCTHEGMPLCHRTRAASMTCELNCHQLMICKVMIIIVTADLQELRINV